MDTIINDKRQIVSLFLADKDETQYKVGCLGITSIEPYYEGGEMGPVVWFAIKKGKDIAQRLNGKFVDVIIYEDIQI